jgi:hypothetical protein
MEVRKLDWRAHNKMANSGKSLDLNKYLSSNSGYIFGGSNSNSGNTSPLITRKLNDEGEKKS